MSISKKFFLHISEPYRDEILENFEKLSKKHAHIKTLPEHQIPGIRRHKNGEIAGSVDLADGFYLYVLIRAFKPKVIFEIGTWTGMSSLFMAEAIKKNGFGHIYTCDINNFYALPNEYDSYVTRINAKSDEALNYIPKETTIDFVFADGDIDTKTATFLTHRTSEEALLSTHDFYLRGEKGLSNLVVLQKVFNYRFTYLLPSNSLLSTIRLRSCVAILVPDSTMQSVTISPSHIITRKLQTLLFKILVKIGSALRRIKNVYRK